jgi:hypothetical protein
MEANSVARDAPWRALFGLLYGFILFVLSLGAGGAPHGGGTGIPLVISSAPLTAMVDIGSLLYWTPLLWAALGYSTALFSRWIPQFLFLLQYVSAVAVMTILPLGLGNVGGWVIVWVVVYLGGQVIFWRAMGSSGRAD